MLWKLSKVTQLIGVKVGTEDVPHMTTKSMFSQEACGVWASGEFPETPEQVLNPLMTLLFLCHSHLCVSPPGLGGSLRKGPRVNIFFPSTELVQSPASVQHSVNICRIRENHNSQHVVFPMHHHRTKL